VTVTASRARPAARGRATTDRILAAFPLLSVFFWLGAVYAWQVWRHGSPWLFTDELQFTQLSRAIAETGHAARRGQPHSFDTLYTYFVAPAWRLSSVHHGYDAIRYLNVVVMTAAVFPAYKLARFVVGRRAALFAATGAIVIPSFAYTGLIVEEPLAYTYSTLCLYLVTGALLHRSRWWIAGAAVSSLIAPLVRGELVVIPATFALGALFLVWRSREVERWRARWSREDWVGAFVLLVGASVLISAVFGHRSHEWLIATGFYPHRMWTLGMRAAGALAIGVGIFAFVAGLASLWRAPGEVPRYEVRVFRSVLLAAVIAFGLYTAVKASFISTTFGTYTVERNLIYLSPLLFVGTALWLERRAAHPLAVAAAAGFALYLVLTTPYEMGTHFYSQAPGFALLEWFNRTSVAFLTPGGAKILLLVILVLTVVLLLAPRYVPRVGVAAALAACAFTLAWSFAGELAGASASNSYARSFLSNIRGDPTWLDKATQGAPTLYLGQQMQDSNSEWLLEFWNRSLKAVWSLDGTAQGPGPFLTPDLKAPDGTLSPDPHYPYVVADRGIRVEGKQLGRHFHEAGGSYIPWTLYRVVDEPLRLRWAYVGVQPDGWMGSDSSYNRYWSPGNKPGTMIIRLTRAPGTPATARVAIGNVIRGPDKQPHLGRKVAVYRGRLTSTKDLVFKIPAPGPRFRVEVHVAPTFKPIDVTNGRLSDARELGAQVSYTFKPAPR
jgi:Dolichyl-phosphate-mannose-protein mannosyltransferase